MAEDHDADDRTEDPTQRRLDEAVKKGDVPRSAEVGTFFVLGSLTLALMMGAGGAGQNAITGLRGFLAAPHLVPDGPAGMAAAGRQALNTWAAILAVPVGILLVGALAGGLVQHRPLWTLEPLAPKFSRLSPGAGFKRLFGKDALVSFGKGLLKLVIVGAAAAVVMWADHDRLESLVGLSPKLLLPAVLTLCLKLLGAVLALHALVTVGDVLYGRFSWMKRQRMTKQEVKDEAKDQDGNPEIKAKLRQIRMTRLKRRMMAAVPTATVVITNPTHYAVALRYERGMAAPICVAKGIDELAQRIKAVAAEHDIPLVENVPLARALHAVVEIDDEIPVEHYKAVAEVIGYVLRLKRRAA